LRRDEQTTHELRFSRNFQGIHRHGDDREGCGRAERCDRASMQRDRASVERDRASMERDRASMERDRAGRRGAAAGLAGCCGRGVWVLTARTAALRASRRGLRGEVAQRCGGRTRGYGRGQGRVERGVPWRDRGSYERRSWPSCPEGGGSRPRRVLARTERSERSWSQLIGSARRRSNIDFERAPFVGFPQALVVALE
jgi:hypothetical protein